MIQEVAISTIQELITAVDKTYRNWNTKARPWFRGEPRYISTPLLPKLYRSNHNELQLLQYFRMKAPMYVDIQIPQRGHTDQWLFLAQDARLPTRLLDWTEGLLIALHFALNTCHKLGAVVWMLNPHKLNQLSDEKVQENDFPITWFSPELDPIIWIRKLLVPDKRAQGSNEDYIHDFVQAFANGRIDYNPGNRNIRAAWEEDRDPLLATQYPVGIFPTAIHPRLTVQRSTFTIWGNDKRSLVEMEEIDTQIACKFVIEDNAIKSLNDELQLLGITRSSLFPDLDNLAKDLTNMF